MNTRGLLVSLLALPALSAAVVATPSSVSASVTLKGCIKWFHPEYPQNNRWPLKFAQVDVEWDGAGYDPEVQTDANGCYKASVRNAAWGFNGHDMNAQVYAKRAFKGRSGRRDLYVQVYESIVDGNPTYVETIQKHINDDSSGSINLWLGNNIEFRGTRRNFKTGNLISASREYYHWNIATADIIGRYYDSMHGQGFKQYKGVDVIAPAFGSSVGLNSYFFHLSNNINLVSTTNPNRYGFKRWVGTLLHEATHALHKHAGSTSSDAIAPGLTMPAVHSMNHETNPNLGWTEAFAQFLPVTYLTRWGGLGKYASYSYAPATSDGRKVTYGSLIEDHTLRRRPSQLTATSPSIFHERGSAGEGGAEAYVAGFLWDLVDSRSTTEVNPNYRAWRAKIPKGTGTCQLENTLSRSYRGLPSNSAVLRDADSNSALTKNTDCLALPMADISRLISRKMFPNVQEFGSDLILGKDVATKYKILKAYANNGLLDAVPSGLGGMKNWTISQATTSLYANPSWGDAGRPANATLAQDRARERVSIEIPIRLTRGERVQFESAKCKFTTSQSFQRCNNYIKRSSNVPVVKVSFKKSDYCNGAGDARRGSVGTTEKAPMYVALDDGVNPIALRVRGVCSAKIISR